jgi:hypothetical protein
VGLHIHHKHFKPNPQYLQPVFEIPIQIQHFRLNINPDPHPDPDPDKDVPILYMEIRRDFFTQIPEEKVRLKFPFQG